MTDRWTRDLATSWLRDHAARLRDHADRHDADERLSGERRAAAHHYCSAALRRAAVLLDDAATEMEDEAKP